jgi:hypothetical protein
MPPVNLAEKGTFLTAVHPETNLVSTFRPYQLAVSGKTPLDLYERLGCPA